MVETRSRKSSVAIPPQSSVSQRKILKKKKVGKSPSCSDGANLTTPKRHKKPPRDDTWKHSSSTLHLGLNVKVSPLIGREKEFNRLISLVNDSIASMSPLVVYISGTPGTGKSATTRLVLEDLSSRNIQNIMVNCSSLRSKKDVCLAILAQLQISSLASRSGASFSAFVSSLSSPLVVVLDEADFVVPDALRDLFALPSSFPHLIIIGIANTVDFTERVLRQMELKHKPEGVVFGRYSKSELTAILSDVSSREWNEDRRLDPQAIQLCAAKVAALSGDLRIAMDSMRQACKMSGGEGSKENQLNICSTPHAGKEMALRAVNGVFQSVYSSPLAKARLPPQPKVLLAVCLFLCTAKKKLSRSTLFSAYNRTCDTLNIPCASGEELEEAFELISSQSFISHNRSTIQLQVDATTAKAAICDNDLLRRIESIRF